MSQAPGSLLRAGVDLPGSMRERFERVIRDAQNSICAAVEELDGTKFREDAWTRPGGGGGITRVIQGGRVFEKAGVNVSVVFGSMPPEAYRAAVGRDVKDLGPVRKERSGGREERGALSSLPSSEGAPPPRRAPAGVVCTGCRRLGVLTGRRSGDSCPGEGLLLLGGRHWAVRGATLLPPGYLPPPLTPRPRPFPRPPPPAACAGPRAVLRGGDQQRDAPAQSARADDAFQLPIL